MSRVITFSGLFPSHHPKAGQPTYFVDKVLGSLYNLGYDLSGHLADPKMYMDNNWWNRSPKNHTIRAGKRWKVGYKFSPRVWKGKPYRSKMYQFAPDIEIKKVWDFEMDNDRLIFIDKKLYAYPNSDFALEPLANNDGLEVIDLLNWFNEPFSGQIICWNENINY